MASWCLPRPIISSAATVAKAVVDIVPMDSKKKVTISWSGGKDSAFALYKILLAQEYEVVSLHTVVNKENKRVGLHGIHETMIEAQVESLGIKLVKLYLPGSDDHEAYQSLMHTFYDQCRNENITGIVFGDIFLEDLKAFREKMLQRSGLNGIFPLWKMNSLSMINDFLNAGFKTMICSANAELFDSDQLGRTIDHKFIERLPSTVDPCGENGEFHTFVYDGPIFKNPVLCKKGEVVKKEYRYKIKEHDGATIDKITQFWFQDLSRG
jgi:uncharacterized protein (TIGR00290 family)